MQKVAKMLHTVDNRIHVIYPLNYSEEQIQGLIKDLRDKIENDYKINFNFYIHSI